MTSAISAGVLIRPKGDDERNAFFRVLAVTRNGWAKCVCVAYADGQRPWSDESTRYTPKFRVSELKPVETLPPLFIPR